MNDRSGFTLGSASVRIQALGVSQSAHSVRPLIGTKGACMPAQPETLRDVLHKVTGSVYVASDLIGRAVAQYVDAARSPDRTVIERCTEAGLALAGVAETLEAALRAETRGVLA
jgi:hypothetical protein